VLAEERWCRDCGVRRAVEAGHIRPVAYGGTDTRSNLKGQCRPCNEAQIQKDRRLMRPL
jgi:5-methylcytosine-specific restriction protein A